MQVCYYYLPLCKDVASRQLSLMLPHAMGIYSDKLGFSYMYIRSPGTRTILIRGSDGFMFVFAKSNIVILQDCR